MTLKDDNRHELVEATALLRKLGEAIQLINETTEDEGDRVYLGSTNDKQTLQDLSDAYGAWHWRHADDKKDAP